MNNLTPKYKRILLKLSGEALAADGDGILDFDFITKIGEVLKKCTGIGVQIAIIVGAGNIWRGRQGGKMNRVRADQMGMLATTINALALQDTFVEMGIKCKVMTAVSMQSFADMFTARDAIKSLEEGNVVILGGGTGSPYFSTDTAAALRAAETESEVILLAKTIDGVYSADPKLDKTAVKYDEISYKEVLAQDLKVMDSTATALCKDNNIPLLVFAISDPENIVRVVKGEKVGTIVS